MVFPPARLRFGHVEPDFTLANVHRKSSQVIAPADETAAAFQIETPTVPVTRQHTVANGPARQWVSHVWTLVVGGIDPTIDVEQRDAMSFHAYRFWFAFNDLRKPGNLDEIPLLNGHELVPVDA